MQGVRRDMEIATGTVQAAMAQQELDPPEIHPRFKEMRRKGVTKHMRMDHLREVRRLPGMPADQVHSLGGHWARAGMAGKEPGLWLVLVPIMPEQPEPFPREHE